MSFTLRQLSDLEEIRQLKHRYFRCIDTGNETELATVFTDDVTIDLRGGGYRLQVKGRENMVAFIASTFNSDIIAQHHGHSPEIRFTGADTARGTWYLEDRFINPARNEDTIGTALYHDQYVRTPDGWKVQHSEYDRVYEIVSPVDPGMDIRTHMLSETGRNAEQRVDTTQWLKWLDEYQS
jgi:SnoaL-like domain